MTEIGHATTPIVDISTHILTRRMTFHSLIFFPALHFNSHPHKEDDFTGPLSTTLKTISTHILTRRMTDWLAVFIDVVNISTHILTRRMTIYYMFGERHRQFQLTSSQGGWPPSLHQTMPLGNFNSHPHKEDDRSLSRLLLRCSDFNSHPHKEDDDF